MIYQWEDRDGVTTFLNRDVRFGGLVPKPKTASTNGGIRIVSAALTV